MEFTLFAPDGSVRTPSRWIVAYTSAPPRDDKFGLQPRNYSAYRDLRRGLTLLRCQTRIGLWWRTRDLHSRLLTENQPSYFLTSAPDGGRFDFTMNTAQNIVTKSGGLLVNANRDVLSDVAEEQFADCGLERICEYRLATCVVVAIIIMHVKILWCCHLSESP